MTQEVFVGQFYYFLYSHEEKVIFPMESCLGD